jgi:hypothetical protein
VIVALPIARVRLPRCTTTKFHRKKQSIATSCSSTGVWQMPSLRSFLSLNVLVHDVERMGATLQTVSNGELDASITTLLFWQTELVESQKNFRELETLYGLSSTSVWQAFESSSFFEPVWRVGFSLCTGFL